MHVDIIGPHVLEGHYDLVVRGAFVDNDTARVSRRLASYPPQPLPFRVPPPPPPPPPSASMTGKVELTTSIKTVAVIAPEDAEDAPTHAAPNSQSGPPAEQEPKVTPLPEPPTKPVETKPVIVHTPPGRGPNKGGRGAILLPELWDDVIEPGMVIQMHMWPSKCAFPGWRCLDYGVAAYLVVSLLLSTEQILISIVYSGTKCSI